MDNRELILSYIPAVMQDEEGNLVNRNIPVTVTVPQKYSNSNKQEGFHNFLQNFFFSGLLFSKL